MATRLLFLIRSLQAGGAERQLVTLVRNMDREAFSISVVTFYSGTGILFDELAATPGVEVRSAEKRGRWDVVGWAYRLWRIVRAVRPEVIHGYMYGANEIALVLGRLVGAKVVWGIRASELELSHYDWLTRLFLRIGPILSKFADRVIVNSEVGKMACMAAGYDAKKIEVIPNGVDLERYSPQPEARSRLRTLWSVGSDDYLIGIVARLDPMKDHATFLRAAALLVGKRLPVFFAIIGAGDERERARILSMARELGVSERLLVLGRQEDMPAIYSALDLVTLSSAFGEGFPNVLGEAMACEKPCVATDVGDTRQIIGNDEMIVPPRAPGVLADAWTQVLNLKSDGMQRCGRDARRRVGELFSVRVLAARTTAILRALSVTQ